MNQYIGIRVNQQLIPLGGKDAPVQPPSYSGDSKFAIYDNPAGGKNVVINAIAAQAHDMSATMKNILEDALGRQAPGIYLKTPSLETVIEENKINLASNGTVSKEDIAELIVNLFETEKISTWNASHRHADALIRHALDPEDGKTQIWAKKASKGSDEVTYPHLGKLIRNAGSGDELVANFPNSAILGYWLSSRSPNPTRVARSLRSQIIGYDAHAVKAGATKLDQLGNLPGDIVLKMNNGELSYAATGKKPSEFGLGAIPSSPEVTGFVCEKINQETVFSFRGIRSHLRKASENGISALESLGVITALASIDGGVYRSNADLVPFGEPSVELIDNRGNAMAVTDYSEIVQEHEENLKKLAPEVFAEAINVDVSPIIINLAASRIKGSMSES